MIPFYDTDFLKKVTVLVETYINGNEKPISLSSGVLFRKDKENFVFTCAHCICEETDIDLQTLNNRFRIELKYKVNNSDPFISFGKTSIVYFQISNIFDIAVITINAEVNLDIPEFLLTPQTQNMTEYQLCFNGYPNGFIQTEANLNLDDNFKIQFDIEKAEYICNDKDYNFEIKHLIDDNTKQKEIAENIKGFSGSGIFVSRDDKNYLIGLFKESKSRAGEFNKLNLFNKCFCVGIQQLDGFLNQKNIYTTDFGFENKRRNHYSQIPYFNKQGFIGRVSYNTQIRDKFFFHNIHQIAIYGNGGIGKTQIALNYYYENKDKYDFAFWVSCEEKENVKISSNKSIFFQDINKCLKVIEDSGEFQFVDSETNSIEKFKIYLSKASKVLLIFDNLDPLSDKKPQELYTYKKIIDILSIANIYGHILVTTQYHGLPEFDSIEVKGFSQEESIKFFKNKIPNLLKNNEDEIHLNELVHELGYLPLALEQAAAYLKSNTNIKRYTQKYKKLNDKLRTRELEKIKGSLTHERSVKATFYLTIRKIKSPLTIYFLYIICFLNPDNIPEDIFEIEKNLFSKDDPIRYFYKDESLENVRATLLNYSIIQANEENSFRIHRLIQQIMISGLSAKTNFIIRIFKKIIVRIMKLSYIQLIFIKKYYSQAFWYAKAFDYIEILILANNSNLDSIYYDSLIAWLGKKSSIYLDDQSYVKIIDQYTIKAETFINQYIESIDDEEKKIVELIRIISENKSSYGSLYKLASLYLKGKQFNKSLYYFELAHSINKKDKAAYQYLAYLYLYAAKRKANYYKKAKIFAKKAYKDKTYTRYVFYTLAEVNKHEGNYLDALTYYNELRKGSFFDKKEILTSIFHCYLNLKNFELADKIAEEIIQSDKSGYLGYYLKGKVLISSGKNKNGIEVLSESLSKEGVRKERVFLSIAKSFFNEKNYESALEYYNYSDSLTAKVNIGLVHFAKKEYSVALKMFLNLYENYNVDIPEIIARTYEHLKQYNEAIQFLLKIEGEDENSKYYEISKIYFKIKEYNQALRIANALVKRNYYNDKIFYLRGSIYFKLQKYKAALTDFRRVEKYFITNKVNDKRFMNLYKNIANLYLKLGDQSKHQLYEQKYKSEQEKFRYTRRESIVV